MISYVLLCRHGAHVRGSLTTTTRDGRIEYPIETVGARLREELSRSDPPGRDQIMLTEIRCAPSPEARESLERLLRAAHIHLDRKMDSAKTFGGLLTLALTVIFGVLFDDQKFKDLADRQWAVQVGGALYLVAAVLYLATMYSYDTLLMPERFWGETVAGGRRHQRRRRWLVERPPSSAAWVLYQNMMRIWRNQFTVASLLVIIATGLLGYAALRIDGVVVLISALPLAALLVWWLVHSRPLLGSED